MKIENYIFQLFTPSPIVKMLRPELYKTCTEAIEPQHKIWVVHLLPRNKKLEIIYFVWSIRFLQVLFLVIALADLEGQI